MHLLCLKKKKTKHKIDHGDNQFKNGSDQKPIMGTFPYPVLGTDTKGLDGKQPGEVGALSWNQLTGKQMGCCYLPGS